MRFGIDSSSYLNDSEPQRGCILQPRFGYPGIRGEKKIRTQRSRSVNPGLKAATVLRLATKRKTVSKVDSNANVGMAPMALTSRLNFFTKLVERSSRLSEDLLLLRLRKSGSPAPLEAECL